MDSALDLVIDVIVVGSTTDEVFVGPDEYSCNAIFSDSFSIM